MKIGAVAQKSQEEVRLTAVTSSVQVFAKHQQWAAVMTRVRSRKRPLYLPPRRFDRLRMNTGLWIYSSYNMLLRNILAPNILYSHTRSTIIHVGSSVIDSFKESGYGNANRVPLLFSYNASAYNNSHGKATLNSLDKASMTITNSKGLNAEVELWCIPTFTSKPLLLVLP